MSVSGVGIRPGRKGEARSQLRKEGEVKKLFKNIKKQFSNSQETESSSIDVP